MSDRSQWIALAALCGTLGNATAAWSTWYASGDQMQIEVRRDLRGPIERIGFIGGSVDEVRSDVSLVATWNVYAINTSRSTTIPLMDFALTDWQFNGDEQFLVNDNVAPQSGLAITYADGKPLLLPISAAPGSVLHFRVKAVFNVSSKAYPKAAPTATPRMDGDIFYSLGGNGLDPFGNTSTYDYPGVLSTTDRKPRAPCLAVAFRTGSGAVFNGQGHYYPEIDVGGSVYLQRSCQDARIDRPWESSAPFITRILMKFSSSFWWSVGFFAASAGFLLTWILSARFFLGRRRVQPEACIWASTAHTDDNENGE